MKDTTQTIDNETRQKKLAYYRQYRIDNLEKEKKRQAEYYAKPFNRIRNNVRGRFSLSTIGVSPAIDPQEALGISIEGYMAYLESLFTNEMTWDNYGTYWSIDHIKQVALFDTSDEKQFREVAHYTNTRPLPLSENMGRKKPRRKKS